MRYDHKLTLLITLAILLISSSVTAQQRDFTDEQVIDDMLEGASFVASADLDDDGDIDLVAAGATNHSIKVYLNNGFGGFQAFPVTDNALDVQWLDIVDMNADGTPDILAAGTISGSIWWYEYVPGCGFLQHTVRTNVIGVNSVGAADFDGDGDVDVAATSAILDGVAWFENTAQGYTAHILSTSFDGASGIAVDDMDNDGDADIIAASYSEDRVRLWRNDGTGQFTGEPVAVFIDGPKHVVAEDLDQDGLMDLVIAVQNSGDILWYKQDGDGNFLPLTIDTDFDGVQFVGMFDVEGDGSLEVFGVSPSLDLVKIWTNTGTFVQLGSITTDAGAQAAAGGDFDSDGLGDLAVAMFDAGKVSWWNYSAETAFTHEFVTESQPGVEWLKIIDFDNDNDLDIVASGQTQLWWYESTADGYVSHQVSSLSNFIQTEVVDIDEDGDLDIFAARDLSYSIDWFENLGDNTSFTHHTFTDFDAPRGVNSGDLDNDGDTDIIGTGGAEVKWYENLGDMNFTEHNIGYYNGASGTSFVFDMNDDGYLDIVTSAFNEDEAGWFENNGNGTFTYHYIGYVNDSFGMAVADIDDDSEVDVVATSRDDGFVYLFMNQGNGASFSSMTLSTGLSGPDGVAAGDFDLDGDLDIAVAESYANQIIWFTNDGNNNFSEEVLVSDISLHELYSADVDDDGDPDIITTSPTQGSISIWRNVTINVPPVLSLTALPLSPPVIIPPGGGSFDFSVLIENTLDEPTTLDAWSEVEMPNGQMFELQHVNLNLQPGQDLFFPQLVQNVPILAPSGNYEYSVSLGFYPNQILVDDGFTFTKTADVSRDVFVFRDSDWKTTGWSSNTFENQSSIELPSKFSLHQPYPNPFNSTSSVVVELPENAHVSVAFYNIEGRRVMQLTDNELSAGSHRIAIDGRSLAAGVYFIHGYSDAGLDVTRKVVLLK